ncbi:EH domain-containing protein 1 [Camelus dromedarius]|uniref:EH domain-containing protein 1 n=1 Tax=Camelus dromedarius TaxID=9838 RepID=A0A5N4EFG0_CAMDR|nr:EH domain-containing protein 1 [Camelus dromedarius]
MPVGGITVRTATVCLDEPAMPAQAVKGRALDGSQIRLFGHDCGEGAGEDTDIRCQRQVGDKSLRLGAVLSKVLKLADVDRDGLLDNEELVLDHHLTKVYLEGHKVPADLPPRWISSSKPKHLPPALSWPRCSRCGHSIGPGRD